MCRLPGFWSKEKGVLGIFVQGFRQHPEGMYRRGDLPIVSKRVEEEEEEAEVQEVAQESQELQVALREAEFEAVVEELRRKARRGHVRQAWQVVATEATDKSLSDAAKSWLLQKHLLHHPLSTSSNSGRACLLAKCGECKDCGNLWWNEWGSAQTIRTVFFVSKL